MKNAFFTVIAVAALFIAGAAFWGLRPVDIRKGIEKLNSEWAAKVNDAELAVRDFRKQLAEQNSKWAKCQWQIESLDVKLVETTEGIEFEDARLAKIEERLVANEPIRHHLDGRTLSEPEIFAQVEMALTKKKALETTRAELTRHREFMSKQMTALKEEKITAPARLLELEASLELLKTMASFHRDRLRFIDENGTQATLKTAYDEAKAALSEAMVPFQFLPAEFMPIEFPDESAAVGREVILEKIRSEQPPASDALAGL